MNPYSSVDVHDVSTVVISAPPPSSGISLNDDPVQVFPLTSNSSSPLDFLRTVSTLNIKQKIELVEIVTGFDTANRYTIYNDRGQPVFYAIENADCCSRCCFGPARAFEMTILDLFNHEVIHISRPLACKSCFFFCCLMNVEVSSPPGVSVGTVQQLWSPIHPLFAVKDVTGATVLRIEGPCITSSCCCGDVEFQILSADGETQVGQIRKKWSGFVQEAFTDADNFNVEFPADLTVEMKATLIGAVFLLDAMYYERVKKRGALSLFK